MAVLSISGLTEASVADILVNGRLHADTSTTSSTGDSLRGVVVRRQGKVVFVALSCGVSFTASVMGPGLTLSTTVERAFRGNTSGERRTGDFQLQESRGELDH